MKKKASYTELKAVLELLYSTYTAEYVGTDPVMFVHRYKSFHDREIAAALSSSLSFGSVVQIKRSIADALSRMGGEPFRYLSRFDPARAKKDFASFGHRFVKGHEFACFLHLLSEVYRTYGSLYALFLLHYSPAAETTESAIAHFVQDFYARDCSPFYADGILPSDSRARFLFVSPERGSACKRMNMFLRWMVRRADGIDFGIWHDVSPAQLIIPLDTHVSRISRQIGLSRHRVANWKMAVEVTENLRRFDDRDPVKYDFAFSRLGILGVCGVRGIKEDTCPLRNVCTCTGKTDD